MIDQLNQNQLLQVLSNEIGFISEVPDILTFIDDDYFLGSIYYDKFKHKSKVYPIWRERLKDLYPTNITTKSSYVVLSGCIGCLSGDTEIVISYDKIHSYSCTIKDIYNDFSHGIDMWVYAANTETKSLELDSIMNAFISGIKETYTVRLSNNTEFRCTSNHQFLTCDYTWLSIDTGLSVGTKLAPEDISIVSIDKNPDPEIVYDLTTLSNHNFLLKNNIFAHNSGKSTFSSIVLMYDYLKLILAADVGSFLDLVSQNGIWLYGCSLHNYKAIQFIEPIKEMLDNCPFIQDLKKQGTFNSNVKIAPAYSTTSIVSTDAAVIWLSEVNEYKDPDKLINASLSRMKGRFQKGMGIFTHFILDCSDTEVNSPTENFIHNSPYSSKVVSYKSDIWTVKPWLYWKMNPKSFKVYGGDSVVSPHVIKDGEDTANFDKDRILEVPMELYPEFVSDVNLALKEKAGLALISGGMFFPEDIKNYFKLPRLIDEVLTIDFYDDTRIIDLDGMEETIDTFLPEDKFIFVGIDCGYMTDEFGMAIGYVDSVSYSRAAEDDRSDNAARNFYIKIPIVFGLSRKPGQETSITKVREFLYTLNKKHPIHTVCYDSFQTQQLAQEMKLIGINTKCLSVEKDLHYLEFKQGLSEGRVLLPDNQLLYKEFKCLKHIGDKVDHSNIEVGENGKQMKGENKKDMCDAVVRCYVSIRNNLDTAVETPDKKKEILLDSWNETLKQMQLIRLQQDNMMHLRLKTGR